MKKISKDNKIIITISTIIGLFLICCIVAWFLFFNYSEIVANGTIQLERCPDIQEDYEYNYAFAFKCEDQTFYLTYENWSLIEPSNYDYFDLSTYNSVFIRGQYKEVKEIDGNETYYIMRIVEIQKR